MSIEEASSISSAELDTCIKVLSKFSSTSTYPSIESNQYDQVRSVVNNLYHIGRRASRQKRKRNKRLQAKSIDRQARNVRPPRTRKPQQRQSEHILVPDRELQTKPTTKTDPAHVPQRLVQSTPCQICKLNYQTLHFFYDQLCPSCAKLNYDKRLQTTDLTGSVALVTGGRVKIGYRIVLKLLRANCFVLTTSRFPMDCLHRLNKETDFEQWKDRVHIYGVDLRYSKLVERFAEMLIDKYQRLDFLINNACQTVRRPTDHYQHLIDDERLTNYSLLPEDQQQILNGNRQFYEQWRSNSHPMEDTVPLLPLPSTVHSTDTTSAPLRKVIFDTNQQLIDLRTTNSSLLRLADVSTIEINEVLTINTLAPFILNTKLKALMVDKHPDRNSIKFIINVSGIEGSFSPSDKSDKHPHTNAAKAALNMMTLTSASDYKQSNIYMVSVDAGWINDENPVEKVTKSMLDEEDAAARVLDPILDTYQQLADGKTDVQIPYGCFLKDYSQCKW